VAAEILTMVVPNARVTKIDFRHRLVGASISREGVDADVAAARYGTRA